MDPRVILALQIFNGLLSALGNTREFTSRLRMAIVDEDGSLRDPTSEELAQLDQMDEAKYAQALAALGRNQ